MVVRRLLRHTSKQAPRCWSLLQEMHSIDQKPALKHVISSAEDDSDLLPSQSLLVREPEDDQGNLEENSSEFSKRSG